MPASQLRSPSELRLAELLASLSLAIDLGNGQPIEWVLKSCLLGARLGEVLGLSEGERRETYYVTLLRHVGCTSMARSALTCWYMRPASLRPTLLQEFNR
jgi:hypothetical protein